MPKSVSSDKYIYVRFYTASDLDLMFLDKLGYDLSLMLKSALTCFACGLPCRIRIPEDPDLDLANFSNFRIKVRLSPDDTAVIKLMDGIKPLKRTAFCKSLLRNALLSATMRPFMSTDEYDSTLFLMNNLVTVIDPKHLISADLFRKNRAKNIALPFISDISQKAASGPVSVSKNNLSSHGPSATISLIPSIVPVSDLANDNQTELLYNIDVTDSQNNSVTDLMDEFPDLFG